MNKVVRSSVVPWLVVMLLSMSFLWVRANKVRICHATPPDTAAQGYVEEEIASDGAVMDSQHNTQHDMDIIPPHEWDGGSFDGKNWSEAGQAIWNNGCAVPVPDTPTPVPDTPTPTFTDTPEPTATSTYTPTDTPDPEDPTPTFTSTPDPEDPTPTPTSTAPEQPTPTPTRQPTLPPTGWSGREDPVAWLLPGTDHTWGVHASAPAGGYELVFWKVGGLYTFEEMTVQVVGTLVVEPTAMDMLDSGSSDLVLITCRAYNAATHEWDKRLIVWADIVR